MMSGEYISKDEVAEILAQYGKSETDAGRLKSVDAFDAFMDMRAKINTMYWHRQKTADGEIALISKNTVIELLNEFARGEIVTGRMDNWNAFNAFVEMKRKIQKLPDGRGRRNDKE